MKKLSRILAVGTFAVFLAGCVDIGGSFLVDPFMGERIQTGDFNSWLAHEYQRRTGVERDVDMEWTHAGRLAEKGYAALHGENVLPWVPGDWNVAGGDMAELNAARARLIAALDSGGRRDTPEACAKSQVYYDGWLEQAHDNDYGPGFEGPVQPDYVASEKAAFYQWIPLCEGMQTQSFIIYFAWDRSDLTDAAVAVVDEIAAFVSRYSNPNVALDGHTDTSGSNRYNVGLSQRRADTVQDALNGRSVSSSSVEWFGETQPAVPTGDGVREPLNRRVEVTISR